MINELCLTARAFGTVENCSSYFSVLYVLDSTENYRITEIVDMNEKQG